MSSLRKLTPSEAEREKMRGERAKVSKHHDATPTYRAVKPRDTKDKEIINGLTQTQLTVYRLRLQGYSFAQIADQVGYANPSGAYESYVRARKKIDDVIIDTKEQRELAISRMDRLLQAVWDRADNGYLPAIDRALKIEERRARILGIDAPERTININQDAHRLDIAKVFENESAIDLVHATLEQLSAIASGNGMVSDGGPVQDGETSDLSNEDPDSGSDGPEETDYSDDAAATWEE